jgi:hypothetical protein
LIILIDLKLLKVTMPATTSTILDQISAEKTKVSERLARLDADRAKVATQLLDLEKTAANKCCADVASRCAPTPAGTARMPVSRRRIWHDREYVSVFGGLAEGRP